MESERKFTILYDCLLEDERFDSDEKLIISKICEYIRNGNDMYASYSYFSKILGISVKSVQRKIKYIVSTGIITRENISSTNEIKYLYEEHFEDFYKYSEELCLTHDDLQEMSKNTPVENISIPHDNLTTPTDNLTIPTDKLTTPTDKMSWGEGTKCPSNNIIYNNINKQDNIIIKDNDIKTSSFPAETHTSLIDRLQSMGAYNLLSSVNAHRLALSS